MPTQAELQTRLDALRKTRDSGALIVRHNDTWTTFRDIDEINQIIGQLESEISGLGSKSRRRRKFIYMSSKGL